MYTAMNFDKHKTIFVLKSLKNRTRNKIFRTVAVTKPQINLASSAYSKSLLVYQVSVAIQRGKINCVRYTIFCTKITSTSELRVIETTYDSVDNNKLNLKQLPGNIYNS